MRRVDPLAGVLLLVGVLTGVSLVVTTRGPQTVQAVYWIVLAVVHLCMAVSSWRVIRLSPSGSSPAARATRRLWRLCCFTGTSYLLGDLLMLAGGADTAIAGVTSNTQTAAVALGTAALTIGLVRFPANTPSREARSRLRLDVATVMAAAVTFGLFVLKVPAGPLGPRWVYELTIGLLMTPGLFLVAIFAVVKLILGGQAPFTRAAGSVCGAAAVLQAVLQMAPDAYYNSTRTAPWLMGANVVSSTLLALGVRIQERQARRDDRAAARKPRQPYSYLPYAAMAATWVASAAVLTTGRMTWQGWTMLGGAMVTTALVVSRQITAFRHIAVLLAERDALTAKLTGLAFHDALTGLGNRALFLRELTEALAAGPVTVFLIDLDDFKPVNDRFGHAAGDHLLVEAGTRLTGRVREHDTVARLGGDEFAVLVRDLHPDQAATLAHDLSQALHGTVRIGDADIPLAASVGHAAGDRSTHDPDSLLHDADMAMYAVKTTSRALPLVDTA